ncbi:aldehyde reductase II [Aspergillus candidus]|uniref:Aldehyde reductase II n=1 Tax=Aspergillus candidus TaxID=41067 RepID=A0A2I2FJV0_ASPCN|nr:aldehyde reductase II [Aspergillus candidus]PLB40899.1 aldehyde reductase II [Aspergillus candidus]
MTQTRALPPGSRILVTGANGYICSHVIDTLLRMGYTVRGTVREAKPWLDELFQGQYGKECFETVIVPGLENADTLQGVMDGVSGIVHVASDLSWGTDEGVIRRAVAGVENVLEAAYRVGSVRRFVLTSSAIAANTPLPNVEGITVDTDSWNDELVAAARSEETPADERVMCTYGASKVEAEKFAWRWMAEKQPPFTLSTVLPDVCVGRILHPNIHGSSMGFIRNLLHGNTFMLDTFPPQWLVDVGDVARLHAVALLDPTVQSERIFGHAKPLNWTDVIGLLRRLRPSNTQIPDPRPNEGRDLSDLVPAKRAEQLLQSFFGQPGWTRVEDSIAEGIEGVQEERPSRSGLLAPLVPVALFFLFSFVFKENV